MLYNKRDSRQVPKGKDICASKKYYDVMYAYLQCISKYDAELKERSIDKKEINFSNFANVFSISRQTASKKFNSLIDMGLVTMKDKNTYLLNVLEPNIATLVPYKTLKLITDSLNAHSINTYVYLLNRYYANGCKPFVFSLSQIKEYIGICATTKSNDDTVTNILFVLQKIGLIRYKLSALEQKDNFKNVKTAYVLEWLTNSI